MYMSGEYETIIDQYLGSFLPDMGSVDSFSTWDVSGSGVCHPQTETVQWSVIYSRSSASLICRASVEETKAPEEGRVIRCKEPGSLN